MYVFRKTPGFFLVSRLYCFTSVVWPLLCCHCPTLKPYCLRSVAYQIHVGMLLQEMAFQRLILFCVLLFAGSVDELIENRWSGHGGMVMVAPRAVQVYHSFLAQGSPHCMVVVKTWPYSGKKLAVCHVHVVFSCCCCSLLDCSPPILMPYW